MEHFWDDKFQEKFDQILVNSHVFSLFSTIGFWRLVGIAAVSVCKRQ